MTPILFDYLRGYQAADERAPRRDRVRCSGCGRWTRSWVVQGLHVGVADPDATSRLLCDHCAISHRQVEVEG